MAKLPYGIIGAGPSGLATARALQKAKIEFIGFEKHSDVGGLWDISNPHSTMYKTAHLISSKRMTEFEEFPMNDNVADYPSHRELFNYFQDYSNHFQLKKYFKFNAEVISLVENSDKTWTLTTREQNYQLAGVIIATGTLHYPNIPKGFDDFKGESLHSSQYKDPSLFKDKRVLIVGCGNSACDIAIDAVHHANKVDISVRRGYHFVPKYIFGKPADTLGKARIPFWIQKPIQQKILKLYMGKPEGYGFPKPDHDLFESHPIVNSLILYHAGHGDIKVRGPISSIKEKTVTFQDGQEEYDLILWATGYKIKYPFIEPEVLNWKDFCPNLYLNIFHPDKNNIFVVGMIEALGIGWQGRYSQAELVAKYISKLQSGSEIIKAFNSKKHTRLDLSGGMNYIKLSRMSYYVHKQTYLDEIKKHKEFLK